MQLGELLARAVAAPLFGGDAFTLRVGLFYSCKRIRVRGFGGRGGRGVGCRLAVPRGGDPFVTPPTNSQQTSKTALHRGIDGVLTVFWEGVKNSEQGFEKVLRIHQQPLGKVLRNLS